MAVPSSGQLREYADIGVELGVAQTNVSLRGMSQTAGFSSPDAMSEFYGYSSAPSIGSVYEGGVVFYIDSSGTRGLIIEQSDLYNSNYEWGCQQFPPILIYDASGIGYGLANSNNIVLNCSQSNIAATAALGNPIGNYFDWYLPSREELETAFNNVGPSSSLGNVANFTLDTFYWTSYSGGSQYGAYATRYRSSIGDVQTLDLNRSNPFRVRSIRGFDVSNSCTENLLDILGDGSCIATYTQNNTGNDLSGNYNASVVGASYISSLFGTSQDLNGARWMDCQNTSSINYANISFSLWFKATTQNDGNGRILIGKGSATNFVIFEYAGTIGVQIKQNGVFNSPSYISFATNQWYHLVFTISGGNTFKLYLNGILQWTGTGTYPQTSENLQIGRSTDGYWQKWNGQIDQVRVFNKALNQSEIQRVASEIKC